MSVSVASVASAPYPIELSIDYPQRPLDRLSTAFRLFYAIPILILAAAVGGGYLAVGSSTTYAAAGGAGGLLFIGPLLMIVFRQKYPQWWFDWNLAWTRFATRVTVYLALMDDRYPSTDEQQSVRLSLPCPDPPRDLNRWLPLVKWLLAIPHYLVLVVLAIGALFAIIGAWFAILTTGRYPRALFDYVEGVIRYGTRVVGYACTLVTDEYPPFQLRA
jgi:uncharacterized membrane-anchored protein YitT (DUF2179 family)